MVVNKTSHTAEQKKDLMKAIKDEVMNLTASPLYKERTTNKVFPVIGEGSHSAKIMFIGEAPGRNEAKTGRPFCGAAGKILDQLLESVQIKREDVYITNIVKDRPPFNRDPLPEEIEVYGPFLDRQIEIIQPKVLATLGRYSMQYIMKRFGLEAQLEPISKMHGKSFNAQASYGTIKIIPLYHPAVAIYNNKTKDTLMDDFKILKTVI
ncbi:uracil-DNA glycosylase [Candidatus Parcubacteria bacterium]|nr:uracil-DNA glycosylase [Candidatus Parcubacteria bacterium]